ncbi:Sigma-70 region 2 domain-containing protein [Clostridium neonatale]|uniref:sigma-70 family RNA polymerase sigma factor n=1 Tax=Clostridium neonatale TaxID=137838 RepID=UPI00291C49E4|nr:sigma-70 family RNA polymerase sigma factor [Clostridium neonatale]CAI3221979.1 Sigma-70 region 2 domain-containing protein [Clostridium neonatale]CAI3591612.1 Sigma-70 region 2 domain-containing protein [Clostridium neonatale]
MDYDYIEMLVLQAKNQDYNAKEKLVDEFTPFIVNHALKSFIYGYEFEDIKSECYKILLKCISSYNSETHRFISYATNSIKNGICTIARKSKRRCVCDGIEALSIHDDGMENMGSKELNLEDVVCNNAEYEALNTIINKLSSEEKELINFIFFNENTTKEYASLKNICYSTALQRKSTILNKLSKNLKIYF